MVVKKFIAPKIDEAPAMCKLKIPKYNDGPVCHILLSGGYSVQPVTTQSTIKFDIHNNSPEGSNSQNDRLFNIGKAIYGAPIKIGTTQLPNPTIRKGITKKKIITKA
jgi:hypothetical protein